MIYIVHGEDTSKSRAQILNQHKKLNIQNKTELSLEDLSPQELRIHLSSNSLFGDASFFVLDVTKVKGNDEYIEVLTKVTQENTVIIYSEKTLTKTNTFLKSASALDAKIIENKANHPENIFKFVETLFSKDRTNTYKEYENLIKADMDPFYISSMIYYGLRSLAKGVFRSPSFENGNSFTKYKVLSQRKMFTETDLTNLYNKTYALEKKLKTGEIDPDLMITMTIENVLNSK